MRSLVLAAVALLGCSTTTDLDGLVGQANGAGGSGGDGGMAMGGGGGSGGAGGTGGVGSTGGGGSGAASSCAEVLFSDDFEDMAVDLNWQTDGPDSFTATEGGQLSMSMGVEPGFALGGYALKNQISFVDKQAIVEVVEIPSNTDSQVFLLLSDGNAFSSLVATGGGDLVVREGDASGQSEKLNVPYVAAQHRFFRMRSADGKLYAETSPDGATWTIGYENDAPGPLSSIIVTIGLATEDAADTAALDAFRLCQ